MAQAIAKKLIQLREALPNTDISKLVARSPAVLLELDPSTIAANVSQLRWVPCFAILRGCPIGCSRVLFRA